MLKDLLDIKVQPNPRVEMLALIVIIFSVVILTPLVAVLVVSVASLHEEVAISLSRDTWISRAGLIIWSIFRYPRHSSELTRSKAGRIRVYPEAAEAAEERSNV